MMVVDSLFRDDLRKRVEHYAGGPLSRGVSSGREQSYDHCFNYFADNEAAADMEKSCAVLGFYLASWGMYRGSCYLLKHTNSSVFRDVVGYIGEFRDVLGRIDVDSYTPPNIMTILDAYAAIKNAIFAGNQRHIVLVTKIMIAAFGCVPAFDRNFVAGFGSVLREHKKLPSGRLTPLSLELLAEFYYANQKTIDVLHSESRTVAFGGPTLTSHKLTKAKIIDMYFYDLGSSLL